MFQVLWVQILFLLVYYTVFRNANQTRFNRLYLLGGTLLSYSIPLLTFSYLRPLTAPVTNRVSLNPELTDWVMQSVDLEKASMDIVEQHQASPFFYALMVIYFVGVLVQGIRLIRGLHQLRSWYRSGVVKRIGKQYLIQNRAVPTTFSVFNFLFAKTNIAKEDPMVYEHEKAHAQLGHSFDLFLFECESIVFWFNPLNVIKKKYLKEVHEFQVDKRMKQEFSFESYSEKLLTEYFKLSNFGFTSAFSDGVSLKKRIIMMKNLKTNNGFTKLSWVALILLLSIVGVSCMDEILNNPTEIESTKEVKSKMDLNDQYESVSLARVESFPSFSGDENLSADEKKKVFSQKVQTFVAENFNPSWANGLGLEKKGKNRIIVKFEIDSQGNLFGVKARAPHQELEQKVIEMFDGFPQVNPAKKDGQAVAIKYALPIVFYVE